MPTLQLLSDLHLEFLGRRERESWIEALDPAGVDILVLAGDICTARDLGTVLKAFCAKFPNVVYVTGNHEYYDSSPAVLHGKMWDIMVENPNLTWLDNELMEVGGLKFFGGSLWFPKPEDRILSLGRWGLNDFHKIRDFEPWVYEQNAKFEALAEVLAPKADVVISHHLPTEVAIAAQYKADVVMNHFFCRDLTEKIKEWKPKLWVFGHTHHRFQQQVGETLLLCNSKGYPHERETPDRGVYRKKLLVQVDTGPGKARVE